MLQTYNKIRRLSIYIDLLSIYSFSERYLLCICILIIFIAGNLITNYHEANNRLFIIDLPRLGNGRITLWLRLGSDRRRQDIL